MLQVARLAPKLLQEASERVAEFLLGELNDDGGARNRAGESDLYYTAFLLEGMLALQVELPRERVVPYLESFGHGDELDLVHKACLVRAWRSVSPNSIDPRIGEVLLEDIERHRAEDGGYGTREGAVHGTLYNAFLALGAYQDVGAELPDPAGLATSVRSLSAGSGGYADSTGLSLGTTPTTAAAATLLRHLREPTDPDTAHWLLSCVHEQGGFLAVPGSPFPDLLSTATALHALSGLQVPFDPLRERCLDFLDTLWTGRSFCGTWEDDELDCEYTFYALLALGHLSV